MEGDSGEGGRMNALMSLVDKEMDGGLKVEFVLVR
jgi:hypothetical protein